MKIVGIAGSNGAGKDTLGDLLRDEYGYKSISLSDILRHDLTELGKSHTRENLSHHSKLLRDKNGDGAMVQLAIQKNKDVEKLCITSIRAPGEVDGVQQNGGKVFWIDANPKIRYERITSRDRDPETDEISFDEFMKQQQAEMTPTKQGGGLNMAAVEEKADKTIINEFPDTEVYKEHLRIIIEKYIEA